MSKHDTDLSQIYKGLKKILEDENAQIKDENAQIKDENVQVKDKNTNLEKENENLKNYILAGGKNHAKTCFDHQGKKLKTFCLQCKTFNCSTCFGNHYGHFDKQSDFGPK